MSDGGEWLYHLPAFLDRLQAEGAQSVLETVTVPLGGVLYHHRGVRVPGYDATFVWHPDEGNRDGATFEVVVDGVGDRAAWARFDAAREWDVYLAQPPDDTAYFAWMTDAEYETDEAVEFDSKTEAVGLGRFSFGLYLQPRDTWSELEARASEVDAPCFIYRPSGRTVVPEGELDRYEEVVPPELLGGTAPEYLGLVEAAFGRE